MSSSQTAVIVNNVSKSYQIYGRPQDRLKQSIIPKLQWLLGMPPSLFYREFWALKDVSFDVRKGETLGIIGRNGSGKSTLLQTICGTLYPTTGRVETFGRVAALLELGAGFNPEFTGRENVYMNGALLGLSETEIDARFEDIAKFAEIGEFIEQPIKTYSSGMYTRLAFSVIVHVNAEILVIDEALATGDAFFVQKCMRFLREFQESGTLIIVSHDTAAVTNLCTRAVWLDQGAVVADGKAKDVCEEYFARRHLEESGRAGFPHRKPKRPRSENDAPGMTGVMERLGVNADSSEFGTGDARIVSAELLDGFGNPLLWIKGGENVEVVIQAVCECDLRFLIMGFHVKDRLGQPLIGDNTFQTYESTPVSACKGDTLEARFAFTLPLLAAGNYSLCAAIASGTPHRHVQHHWVHDAFLFTVHENSLTGALVGVPMKRIALNVKAIDSVRCSRID